MNKKNKYNYYIIIIDSKSSTGERQQTLVDGTNKENGEETSKM